MTGIPCPQCNSPIAVEDPWVLFTNSPIVCMHCGLELRVNRSESMESLDTLRSFLEEVAPRDAGSLRRAGTEFRTTRKRTSSRLGERSGKRERR
jgi:hypothetical protein